MNDVDLNRLLVTIIKQFGPFVCSGDEFINNYMDDYGEVGIAINFSEDGESICISLTTDAPEETDES